MRRPIEFWLEARGKWIDSGLSKREYCRRNALCLATFNNKLRDMREGECVDPGGLVQVRPEAVAGAFQAEGSGVRIYAAGVGIEVDEGFSRETLAAVLEVLRA